MLAVHRPWVLRKSWRGGCGIWAGRGGSRIKPEDAPAPPGPGVAHLPASGSSALPTPPTACRSQLRTAQRDRGCNQTPAISPQVVTEVV